MTKISPIGRDILPPGISARFIEGVNGLTMHVLEAGEPGHPVVLLLHGFPELAYSWRRVMPALAAAGYHVIAPDQRGYGRTVGWDPRYDGDLRAFSLLNIVLDTLSLVAAYGLTHVDAVVGHDFGASVAAYCALVRPDVFRAVSLMSAPFGGPPPLTPPMGPDIHGALAALDPPRRHYQWYYSTPGADDNMWHAKQGVHDFLRAYYHHKSADWPGNTPYPLAGWTASELAKLPTYYIMPLHRGMAETVAAEMPTPAQIAACTWLSESELGVYSGEYARVGFQGGLQWYRCRTVKSIHAELQIFAGRSIDVPSCFIAGAADWGIHQKPGDLEAMRARTCTDMRFCELIPGAGHWVQQEQSSEVSRLLLAFLTGLHTRTN